MTRRERTQPGSLAEHAVTGGEYDARLVVGGCCACCADLSGLAGRRVVRLRRAEDLEEAAEILAAL